MKKLFYFAFMAMLCCGFVACSVDDDNGDNGSGDTAGLVGMWRLVKDVYTQYGETTTDYYGKDEFLLSFQQNGQGYWIEYEETEYFDYVKTGSRLILDFDGDFEEYKIVTLTNEELILSYEWEKGSSYEMTGTEYYVRVL